MTLVPSPDGINIRPPTERRRTRQGPRCARQRPTVQAGPDRAAADALPGLGLARHDPEWSAALDDVLMATRRGDLNHSTLYAYGQGSSVRIAEDVNADG